MVKYSVLPSLESVAPSFMLIVECFSSNNDVAAKKIYGDTMKNTTLTLLSLEELEAVNGGFGNFAFGAVVGAASYGIGSAISGNFSWGGLGGSIVAGAVTSGFSTLAGGGRVASAYFGTVGAGAGGASSMAINEYIEILDE